MWTVPALRMKAGREHRVPLSPRALTIIKVMHELRDGDFVFPSARHPGKSLAVRTLWRVMRGMRIRDATVHGFRSAFRDWAAECTNFPSEVCEAALAHSIANKVEAAYRRGDLLRSGASSWKHGTLIALRQRPARSWRLGGSSTTLLRQIELHDLTVHGFRATFKIWASERTSFQNEIVEAALAHVVGDKLSKSIGAATCSRSGAASCSNGRYSAPPEQLTGTPALQRFARADECLTSPPVSLYRYHTLSMS